MADEHQESRKVKRRDFLSGSVAASAIGASACINTAVAAQTNIPSGTTSLFKVRFKTDRYRPGCEVSLLIQSDLHAVRVRGVYQDDCWVFECSSLTTPRIVSLQFSLNNQTEMIGEPLEVQIEDGACYSYSESEVNFPNTNSVIIENSHIQRFFFPGNRNEDILYDVIVIGSGAGGGVLADQLADSGQKVLVLELGSLVFPSHIANLPRRQKVGEFDKHVWGLWYDFKVDNFKVDEHSDEYIGGAGINLGGRTVFWGGLIPRMSKWELDTWPKTVAEYLQAEGYDRADRLVQRSSLSSEFQSKAIEEIARILPDFDVMEAPLAVGRTITEQNSVATGMFSTADLLMESSITPGRSGNENLTVNLNHRVLKLNIEGGNVTSVDAEDLISRKVRRYRARNVVLAAGTVESAKLAIKSGVSDPNRKIGVGITDHTALWTHFGIDSNCSLFQPDGAAKIVIRHKASSESNYPFIGIIELGADFNQSRYVDPDIVLRHQSSKPMMLCEIVFIFFSPLVDSNKLYLSRIGNNKPNLLIKKSNSAEPYREQVRITQQLVLNGLGAKALPFQGESLNLNESPLGAVAHEVGTLRMGVDHERNYLDGVVDDDLKFVGMQNLYACDLSVFPNSPAVTPTLTLIGLAHRLAKHLRKEDV